MCESKLPQLSGHVESSGFVRHEKLKSCPDRTRQLGWVNSTIVDQADDELHICLAQGTHGES